MPYGPVLYGVNNQLLHSTKTIDQSEKNIKRKRRKGNKFGISEFQSLTAPAQLPEFQYQKEKQPTANDNLSL